LIVDYRSLIERVNVSACDDQANSKSIIANQQPI